MTSFFVRRGPEQRSGGVGTPFHALHAWLFNFNPIRDWYFVAGYPVGGWKPGQGYSAAAIPMSL
jgi:hypothetical protein